MITSTGTYALRAMAYLARRPLGTRVSAQSLGTDLGLPPTYLGKVLQALARHQLLLGLRGRNGGYRLIKAPAKINLLEVLSAVERVDRYDNCLLGHPACPGAETCPMQAAWGLAPGRIRTLFKKTTLEDLARHDELAERAYEVQRAKARPKRKVAGAEA